MSQRFCAAALVPSGFTLERFDTTEAGTEVVFSAIGRTSVCPECETRTSRVHSRYWRRLGGRVDLSGGS